MSERRSPQGLISVVIPVFEEAGSVRELLERVLVACGSLSRPCEVIFVDDGSQDATPDVLRDLCAQHPEARMMRLTRSFGHQAALCAGLEVARGVAAVTMDGDLQHPPELLGELVREWESGADVVNAIRREGSGAGPWKESSSRGFYRLMNLLSSVPVQAGGADFRLLDRRVIDAFNGLQEHFVFARGLVPWLGFRAASVEYDEEARQTGESKYTLRRMVRLGLDGIFSFSVAPLRLITLLGLATATAGLLYGAFALFAYLAGLPVETGWTSLVVLVLTFGGVQLFSLGIVSEYVGRMYEEVKRRPRYVIEYTEGMD